MVCKNRGIYGVFGPSWVLNTMAPRHISSKLLLIGRLWICTFLSLKLGFKHKILTERNNRFQGGPNRERKKSTKALRAHKEKGSLFVLRLSLGRRLVNLLPAARRTKI